MKVKLLSDVKRTHSSFEPTWEEEEGGIYHPNFASIRHVVICKDDGEPLWDQLELREQSGSIIVPYFVSKGVYYLGVVEQGRPIIENPLTNQQGDVISIEFPRGFAAYKGENLEEIARRELTEETQSVIKELKYLGSINPLTSFYVTQKVNEVFAANVISDEVVRLKEREGLSKEAEKEQIISSEYIPLLTLYGLIKSGKMFCGLSQAALTKFMISIVG